MRPLHILKNQVTGFQFLRRSLETKKATQGLLDELGALAFLKKKVNIIAVLISESLLFLAMAEEEGGAEDTSFLRTVRIFER